MTYSLQLIDICLPCYLQDHHNREGELLLGVPVDGRARVNQVRRAVHDELQAADYGLPESFSYDNARAAINRCFDKSDGRRTFDPSLDKTYSEDSESCYAYFLLRY